MIGGVVNLPELSDMRLAALINKTTGGAVVAPWDIKHLPIEWFLTFNWMVSDLPGAQKIAAEQAKRVAEVKAKHTK